MSASQNAVTGVLSAEGGDAYLQLNIIFDYDVVLNISIVVDV
jgi:hypothetical protein